MTPRVIIVPVAVNAALWVVTALVALWRGGWREKLIALVWAAGGLVVLAFLVGRPPNRPLFSGASLSTDIPLLIAALVCLRRGRRYWVIGAAAFALLEVITDTIFLVAPSVTEFAFASAHRIWGWALEAVIVWASLTHRRGDPAGR